MSLATRCTHCGTIFKVVQDQLKVSEGWVRCGRCNEVFNALPSLFDLEKDAPPPRVSPSPAPAHAPEGVALAAEAAPRSEPFAAVSLAEAPSGATVGEPASSPGLASSATLATEAPPEAALHIDTDAATHALQQQGLLSEPDVDLGLESQPPSGWEHTQPLPRQAVDEGALALDPTPIEATTDFELDTSIAVDDNTPLEDVIAATMPRHLREQAVRPPPGAIAPTRAPQPASELDEDAPLRLRTTALHPAETVSNQAPEASAAGPHSAQAEQQPASAYTPDQAPPAAPPWYGEPPLDLPTTEEEDALDSRYLMPSPRERHAPHRLEEGPEFVDAQFPSDALLDAEEEWASDFGPSALDADAPQAARATGLAMPLSPAGSATSEPARDTHPHHPAQAEPPHDAAPLRHEAAPDTGEAGEAPPAQHDEEGPSSGYPLVPIGVPEAETHPTPAFVRHAHRKAFWRRPAVRAGLSVFGLVLLASLGLQMLHQFRDLVAAYHPASRPLLEQWCQFADCRLAPPLRLEDLQIDSDPVFVRAASEGPDIYRLSVVVHNKAPVDLAWPHVDLTLTDASGAVLARRVLDPHDALWRDTADPKPDVPTPAEAASVPTAAPGERSTTLQWRLVVRDIQPVSYTAELFYP